MTAQKLDGRPAAEAIYAEVGARVRERLERGASRPGLATVLVGNDPASETYVKMKGRNCEQVGMASFDHRLPAESTTEQVLQLVRQLNADDAVSGILVQSPMPPQVDASAVVDAVDPAKDVDGLHPYNAGRLAIGDPTVLPCTPAGIMNLLDRTGVDPKGLHATVLGRSNLVGKPVALLLLMRHATVTLCHSRTADLAEECRRADILVAAVGQTYLVQPDWVKPGAVVVDVGTNRLEGKLVGDVDPGVAEVAGWLTPSPGGVGPMTRAMLIRNTLLAEERRRPLSA